MGSLRRFNLRAIRALAGIGALVETGTGTGDSLRWALRCGFDEIHSVEIEESLYLRSSSSFAGNKDVRLHHGNSIDFLAEVAPQIERSKLIYLDAHFAGGADFGISTYQQAVTLAESFPLLGEVAAIRGFLGSNDILIIDDARMYLPGSFQLGECPDFARQWDKSTELESLFEYWSETHVLMVLESDQGYFSLIPKHLEERVPEFLNFLPHDGDQQQFAIQEGVAGVTSISVARRIQDSRFATRYFVGAGLDVGGGRDSLALYREFFPRISSMFVYDACHGDAQELANVPDHAFDFLYSSHCLEHLRDPRIALRNWLRVVKPGGYLVIQVPDEDLYEKGHWPSQFNSDHKLTFTIAKEASWSPVSVNVLDLVRDLLAEASPLSISLIDNGYRYRLQDANFDQTRTPLAEAGIEFILAKSGHDA
jgi:hypothetical protein